MRTFGQPLYLYIALQARYCSICGTFGQPSYIGEILQYMRNIRKAIISLYYLLFDNNVTQKRQLNCLFFYHMLSSISLCTYAYSTNNSFWTRVNLNSIQTDPLYLRDATRLFTVPSLSQVYFTYLTSLFLCVLTLNSKFKTSHETNCQNLGFVNMSNSILFSKFCPLIF